MRPRRWARPDGKCKLVTVTGGAGYIGSRLTRRLLAGGYRVRVLDRLDFGVGALAGCLEQREFELIEGDLRDLDSAARALRDADAVIHLAAVVGDPACAARAQEAEEINVDCTRSMARLASGLGVRRMLLASTCSVYGANPEFVSESSELRPVSLYARTKIAAEGELLAAGSEDFHPTVLRIGTAYGWSERPRFDLVVNLLTAKARVEKRAVIYNDEQWRPFVHVDDIARGFEAALAAPVEQISGETFNLGSNDGNHRLSSIGDALRRLHPDAQVAREKNGDRRDYRVRFDKIEARLGFRGRTTLEAGIGEIDRKLASGAVTNYQAAIYHNHATATLHAPATKPTADSANLPERRDLARLGEAVASASLAPLERAPAS